MGGISLETTGLRFNSTMTTVDGVPFSGTVEQMDEGRLPSYDFSEARLILRVAPTSFLRAGKHILDVPHRRWILGDYDIGFSHDNLEYKTFRMFRANSVVAWSRSVVVNDPITGQPRSNKQEAKGNIWVLMERQEREFPDSTLRVKEETKRVITSEPVKLGDTIDGMVIKRLDVVWGVNLVDVQ